jgi:cation diffusion facilitator CzcD-associated flavoprotein CzcO
MTSVLTAEPTRDRAPTKHFDVLVVGAGLSGIAAGYYLSTMTPKKSYAILEGRDTIGGTWDLFRYPGVRSDSDMHTLGYSFRPWPSDQSITDGPSILNYVRDTARVYKIDEKIRYQHRAIHASWSSDEGLWTLDVAVGPERQIETFTCNFLFMCSGYYDYAEGYLPEWADRARYRGTFVHPQHWPEHLDYAGKSVVIIGSGATAVTLAPSMADAASHVTMLQRTPTYIIARPAIDPISKWAREKLPAKLAGGFVRWKNVLLGMLFFNLSKRRPEMIKKLIAKGLRRHLGDDFDIATHFTPTYNPWDQRVCLVPDADLFKAIRSGKVSVVTDHIERFTETGLQLRSGKTLDADIVVGATGLKIQLMGGMTVSVDGEPVDFGKRLNYKGMMYSGVPNLASAFGYTNASWTLKCELTAKYVCRMINYMAKKRYVSATPQPRGKNIGELPALDFTSGYVQRAKDVLPKQGARKPWRLYQNYALDLATLKYGKIADGTMRFAKLKKKKRQKVTA